MKLKLIIIAALMLSMVGLAGCFEEDYPYGGYYPGYYSSGPAYYGGWWGDGDWDDYPHYHHWDRDDWGFRHGGWEHEGWLAPRGESHERGSVFARNESRGFGGGFHAAAPAFRGGARAGGGFHGGGHGRNGRR